MSKRIFLVILDSFGIGNAPDAAEFGDAGSNTLAAVAKSGRFSLPNMQQMGLFNIDQVDGLPKVSKPIGAFGRLQEKSRGKDTTVGHWEIAGVVSEQAMPTYPGGLPKEMLAEFERLSGRKAICGLPYSGTDVIRDYGEEHMKTGALIVYTSADSVFQIAANEAMVPLEELYRYCEIARKMLTGEWAVGRVIARPFVGTAPDNFKRTSGRHDYSLTPPLPTVLDALCEAGKDVIGVGKIYDIFAGRGVAETIKTTGNDDGMAKTLALADRDFEGLCFVNLVDFDMVYGHRNDVDGYAGALSAFDNFLTDFLPKMREEDILLITADHGCDPSTSSTDHSRETVPLLAVGKPIKPDTNLHTRLGFACVANLIAGAFGLPASYPADDIWPEVKA